MSVRLRVTTGSLASIGAAITGYLTLAHYHGARLVCPTSGCETVQHSRYALLFGIPVALLGLLAFVAIVASAIFDTPPSRTAGAAVALSVFLFSGYLLVVQLTVIHALCTWCVASDGVATLLLPASWVRLAMPRNAAGFP